MKVKLLMELSQDIIDSTNKEKKPLQIQSQVFMPGAEDYVTGQN